MKGDGGSEVIGRGRLKLLGLVPALLLSACGGHPKSTPEPIVVPQTVVVPVAGACVPKNFGAPPEYVDSDEALLKAIDGAVRFQLLIAGREQRQARLREVEPVIAGCPKAK